MYCKKFSGSFVALMLSALAGYYLGYQHAASDLESTGTQPNVIVAEKSGIGKTFSDQPESTVSEPYAVKISGLQEQISLLRGQYDLLKDQSRRAELDESEMQALPALVKASLERLPMEMIMPGVERYTSIPAAVVESMHDQRAFVNRLTNVAMEGIVDEPNLESEPILGLVNFSKNPGMALPQNVFPSTDLVVFAEFDSYNFDQTQVLVKWYRVGDGKVFLFKQMPIRSNNSNYVWLSNVNGIEPGDYRVEMYNISQEMELLSAGSYRVESVL